MNEEGRKEPTNYTVRVTESYLHDMDVVTDNGFENLYDVIEFYNNVELNGFKRTELLTIHAKRIE